jgi:hypothetical protein
MKFSYLDDKLGVNLAVDAKKKFDSLFLELGVREDNCHVGSGLGGNNFQLLVLMSLEHKLLGIDKKHMDISVNKNSICWSAEWLKKTTMGNIRRTLDKSFDSIVEHHKYLALALEDLSRIHDLRISLEKHKDQFPEVVKCLESKSFHLSPKLTVVDQLIIANILCQELATDLDKGDNSRIQIVGSALNQFPVEVILMSIRRYIQIERLVKYNLDEDPIFSKCIDRVNRLVD